MESNNDKTLDCRSNRCYRIACFDGVIGDAMILPNDVSRCLGENDIGLCKHRLDCERYLQRNDVSGWTPFITKMCQNIQYEFKIERDK